MTEPAATSFFNDPRVAEARRLVLDALAERQAKLTSPRPPDPARRASYDELIQRFSEQRGGALYYPYLGSGFGCGALVELADGSVKYDMISGIGVHGFGHGHPTLVAASFDAALRDTVMQGNLQQNAESAELVDLLIATARRKGAALSHCFLTTSGAMANENALKLAFQKHHPADRVLAFERCFMGRSLAMAQLTDKAAYRAGLPTTLAVDYVPFFDTDDPTASTRRAVAALKAHLHRYPGKHAVMSFEFVQGEGGYWPGERGFFVALMDVLKDAGVAVMADEIQTFARCDEPFAFQHFGLDRYIDIATVGKITQVCATFFSDAYKPKPGLISQTFTGATASIFAALAMLRGMLDGGCFGPDGRITRVRARFVSHLEDIARRRPDLLRGPFGFGAMIAFMPLGGTGDDAKRFLHALFDAGVIAFVAGDSPARARMLPPVGAVTDGQIDDVCRIIEQILAAVAGEEKG
jgi:4-aminobutyrate aminotransferase-like enzyme